MSKTFNYLKTPLTLIEIENLMDEQNFVEGLVAVKDRELLKLGYEDFLDLLSEKLVGNPCLQEIQETMIGCEPENNLIIYHVRGDVSAVLDLTL